MRGPTRTSYATKKVTVIKSNLNDTHEEGTEENDNVKRSMKNASMKSIKQAEIMNRLQRFDNYEQEDSKIEAEVIGN